jgi:hypothetical protein
VAQVFHLTVRVSFDETPNLSFQRTAALRASAAELMIR